MNTVNMKKITLSFSFLLASILSFCQTSPSLIIDGKAIKFESDISLPYWLDAGKTVSLGANAASVSIIEFTIDSNNLIYNKTIHLTSSSSVPNGKTWKLESIGVGVDANRLNGFSTNVVPSIFSSPQTFNYSQVWVVPPGVFSACFEVWGAGGRGTGGTVGSNKFVSTGGGGGYGYECINVTPGDSINLIISDTVKVDKYFYVTSGKNGDVSLAKGGDGGTSNAKYSINGRNGTYSASTGVSGGAGANGGFGGSGSTPGSTPGGGSSAVYISTMSGGYWRSTSPGLGQIKIYF